MPPTSAGPRIPFTSGLRCRLRSVPLRLRVADDLEVTIGQQPVTTVRDDEGWWMVQLPPVEACADFRVTAQSGPVTIGVPADAGPNPALWLVQSEEGWSIRGVRTGALEPPHRVGEPVQPLAARRFRDGLYGLPAPALGHLLIHSASKPALRTGESVDEAQSGLQAESREDLEPLGHDRWRSRHPLGLRYLTVGEAEPTGVVIEAEIRSAPRRGAFACSDELLNRIWAVSAYTLRLCMQRLMIDGIKRDRMPWAGDQALSTLANAYAFGDETIAIDSSVASGRPRHGYINGISDYSLWWVINNGLLARYFGSDSETFTRRARSVQRFLEDLTRYVGDDSVFRPQIEADGFGTSAGSVFLDFWEEFTTSSTGAAGDHYAMYGRPFGRSLCHAWNAGPAALLPELVLGVRPLSDGWSRFAVAPDLGDLEWAGAVVPVPGGGTIVASADRGEVSVDGPAGLVLERPDGAQVAGPGQSTWTIG